MYINHACCVIHLCKKEDSLLTCWVLLHEDRILSDYLPLFYIFHYQTNQSICVDAYLINSKIWNNTDFGVWRIGLKSVLCDGRTVQYVPWTLAFSALQGRGWSHPYGMSVMIMKNNVYKVLSMRLAHSNHSYQYLQCDSMCHWTHLMLTGVPVR